MKIAIIVLVALGILFFANKARSQSSSSYKNINAAEFIELQKDSNSVVIDVRTPAEIKAGKIKGALEMNIMDSNFIDKVKKLDPSKTYLIYCRSGNRSGKACGAMANEGFSNLYNLMGGYGAWSAAKK